MYELRANAEYHKNANSIKEKLSINLKLNTDNTVEIYLEQPIYNHPMYILSNIEGINKDEFKSRATEWIDFFDNFEFKINSDHHLWIK